MDPRNLNRHNISTPFHKIAFRPGSAVAIALGDGFVMDDALFPDEAPRPPFRRGAPGPVPPTDAVHFPPANSLVSATSTFYRATSVYEEARHLSFGFQGHLGIVDARTAYDAASRQMEERIIFYLTAEVRGDGLELAPNESQWTIAPPSESIDDPQERLLQFLGDHGSHYVTRLYFGQKILLRVSSANKSAESSNALTAALSAVALFWSAGVTLGSSARNALTSSETTVELAIIGGSLMPAISFIRLGLDDALSFISQLRSGAVTITSGPVECDLSSYWNTLHPNYPRCRAVVGPFVPALPGPPIGGVPGGTIVSWCPREENIIRNPDGTVGTIIPPPGWILCDGRTVGVPDLTNRFLRGTSRIEQVGLVVGSNTHSHRVQGRTEAYSGPVGWTRLFGGDITIPHTLQGHTHDVALPTDDKAHVPESVQVFYIMKT